MNPFSAGAFFLALALIEMWWRRRLTQVRLMILTTIVLALGFLSTPIAVHLASGSLEQPFPPHCDDTCVRAIVVLGGDVLPPDEVHMAAELSESTLIRCLKGVELYQNTGPCEVLLCGGRLAPDTDVAVSHAMHNFMLTQHIPDASLVVEDRSTTTHENAVEAARLLRDRNIDTVALVTDAIHLRRASACFRAQGINVVPVGCRYRSTGFQWRLQAFVPGAKSAAVMTDVSHEWLGLLWYRICGWI